MKNLLVAQSGGPTAAINATLAGVCKKAFISGKVDKIYGGINGIKGILSKNIKEIGPMLSSVESMSMLVHTPAAALGTCRYKLDNKPETFQKIIEIFREFEIAYFVYIGGNDSMDTVNKLSIYCAENGIKDIQIMGAPKTIDNDLCVTDHTPGFGTAAKYIGITMAEVMLDVRVYDSKQAVIVETMGRNTGWLAASACLSGLNGGPTPHLIYLPEVPFDDEVFIADVKAIYETSSYAVIVVSEGVKDANGTYLCEKETTKGTDSFGHKFLSGAGKYLEQLISTHIGCKVRTIDFSLMQRCSGHIASLCDLEESMMLGEAALDRALNGISGEMPYIERLTSEPYTFRIGTTSVSNIANFEKKVPIEWLNDKKNNVNEKMLEYLKPLVQGEANVKYKNGIPQHIKLY